MREIKQRAPEGARGRQKACPGIKRQGPLGLWLLKFVFLLGDVLFPAAPILYAHAGANEFLAKQETHIYIYICIRIFV